MDLLSELNSVKHKYSSAFFPNTAFTHAVLNPLLPPPLPRCLKLIPQMDSHFQIEKQFQSRSLQLSSLLCVKMIQSCVNQNRETFPIQNVPPTGPALPGQTSSVAWELVIIKGGVNSGFIFHAPSFTSGNWLPRSPHGVFGCEFICVALACWN